VNRAPASFHLYRTATAAFHPLAAFWLKRRLRNGREDPLRWREKLGETDAVRPAGQLIWFHAASIGELNAVMPLVEDCSEAGLVPLVTTGTKTSAEIAQTRLHPPSRHQFAPLDIPSVVSRFLDHWNPDLAVFAESEIWPNQFEHLAQRQIPIVLVNARMSDRSFRTWRHARLLAGHAFSAVTRCCAQSAEDARRFRLLGCAAADVAGNIKFDAALSVQVPDTTAERDAIGTRPVFLAASVHPGEAQILADADSRLRQHFPDLLTIIVPRHPEKAGLFATAFPGALRLTSRSVDRSSAALGRADVYLADTIGEVGTFYTLARAALIGGTFIAHGGQNPLEALRLGCPVLHGPDTRNFRDVFAILHAAGVATAIPQHAAGEAIAIAVKSLLTDPQRQAALAAKGRAVLETNAGARERMRAAIFETLVASRTKAG
jgi:3-deoxy-D-manno-octulosonic-acid transferase